MIYVQVEEQVFKAKTPKILVQKLYKSSFDRSINKQKFMFNVQKRIENLYNKHISRKNYTEFLEDLDKLGLIHIFRCMDCDHYVEHSQVCLKQVVDILNPKTINCEESVFKELLCLKKPK